MRKNEKYLVETVMEGIIAANKSGIDTRVLMDLTQSNLIGRIPNLNRHHLAGMLSWVYRAYNHRFLVRTPGVSIIV